MPNLQGSIKEVASVDGPGLTSVDQICEENIELFMRSVLEYLSSPLVPGIQ